jgi:putative cardiolipin synthase
MHNKSFTADNQVTIVGGRNIGDVYFEAQSDFNYADFDVVAVGPVVRSVSNAFDTYWNSDLAVPIAILEKTASEPRLEQARKTLQQHVERMRNSDYIAAVRASGFLERLRKGGVLHYWGEALAVYDPPVKAVSGAGDRTTYVKTLMRPVVLNASSEVIVLSAYFVPADEGMRVFRELRERGVRIRVLTNSLASNDVPIVYAGYARYRKPLLRAGVELYELKRSVRAPARESKVGPGKSSEAGLHSKVYIFDRRKTFAGSFNLDPRSRHINTELGILFDDAAFSELVASRFDQVIDRVAYRLRLTDNTDVDGRARSSLQWIARNNGDEKRFDTEPNTSAWQRIKVWFMALLPVEGQL